MEPKPKRCTMKLNTKPLFYMCLILLLGVISGCSSIETSQLGDIKPTKLNCEYRSDIALIDNPNPRLGWINLAVDPADRGLSQSAYQIRVASSKANLVEADIWDSGKIQSNNSLRIVYQGKKLESRKQYWWQVKVWDQSDKPSDWSEVSSWRMGLIDDEEWKAEWIGAPWDGEEPLPRSSNPGVIPDNLGSPAPMFRKEFKAARPIKQAIAYVTGLGYFELYTNGEKIGDEVLVPNQTNYGKRPKLPTYDMNVPDEFKRYKVMYLAYDLTEQLTEGDNALGVMVGNGFYNPGKFWSEGYGTPRMLLQLHITYDNGEEEIIVSDHSWKVDESPVQMNMVYYGEHYDARKIQKGWSQVGFNDSAWQKVVNKKAPEGDLVAHTSYPDKIIEDFKPVDIKKVADGHYQVDFGVEISGWVRFAEINGEEGDEISVSFNGNLYSGENRYICSGETEKNYAPRFNWFVFSGVEIRNWPGELTVEDVTAEAVNTYIEDASEFSSSNPLFEEIVTIWKRSQEDNMHGGIASDCPHRERNGYTGDAQVACPMVMQTYDARNFYYKWVHDMLDAQIPETGYVPNCAPWQPGCGGGVAWGAAVNIIPWEFFQQYGDTLLLDESYEVMKGYVRYLENWATEEGTIYSQREGVNGEILKWFNLGDWAPVDELPSSELVHTFYYWLCTANTSKAAEVLGFAEEAEIYAQKAQVVKEAFHAKFYDEELFTYGVYGSNILALEMGVPSEVEEMVLNSLMENIQSNGGHFDTGIFGTRYFFEVLSKYGLHQLAYKALNKKKFPSFGYWLEEGSTTSREHWANKGSYNHPMFGGGLIWFYETLAGMKAVAPGYREITFKPGVETNVESAAYSRQTALGNTGIDWKDGEELFSMKVEVPVGSTALVYLPGDDQREVLESGMDPRKAGSVEFSRKDEGYLVYKIGSGIYDFEVKK